MSTTAKHLSASAHWFRQTRTRLTLIWSGASLLLAGGWALASRPDVVKSRNQLLDVAYQDDVYVDDRTIDSHVKRVRKKFRTVDDTFNYIETLYGIGYRYKEH